MNRTHRTKCRPESFVGVPRVAFYSLWRYRGPMRALDVLDREKVAELEAKIKQLTPGL